MSVRFGEYRAESGEAYSYHVTFERVSGGVKWRAIVRNATGALMATPQGMVALSDEEALDDVLRGEVARAIDLRDASPDAVRR